MYHTASIKYNFQCLVLYIFFHNLQTHLINTIINPHFFMDEIVALIQSNIVNIFLSEIKARKLLWLSKMLDFILRILTAY